MIVKECRYEPPHHHEFPGDWCFGGANGEDPRADPRWTPTTYNYLDSHLDVVWTTQAPLCDDQALDEFTKHRDLGVQFIQVRRPGSREFELLAYQYDGSSDTVFPMGV